MASGETLLIFTPQCNEPPALTFATFDTRNAHPVLDFSLTEIAIFSSILPRHYNGGGLTVYLHYAMTSAIEDDIKLETSFEQIGETLDIDADSFAAAQNTGDITVPETSGYVDIITTTHNNGAEIDNLLIGKGFRLKIKRIAAAEEAAGELELRFVEIKET